MKTTAVSCVLFVLLICGTVFSQYAIESACENLSNEAKTLQDAVQKGDWDTADGLVRELKDDWEKTEKWITALTNHGDTDVIATVLASVTQFERFREIPELMAEVHTLSEHFMHIPKKQRPTLQNIL